MHDRPIQRRLDRRGFLRAAAALAAGTAVAPDLVRAAMAEDSLLEALMRQSGDLGEGFDAASRTLHMPKSSLPTLSPATVQTTEQAIPAYESLVAQGGWQPVPSIDKLRVGTRHAGVVAMRSEEHTSELQSHSDLVCRLLL